MGFSRKFSSSVNAHQVFDEMTKRSLYQWNTLLKSLSREKQWEQVLFRFTQMFRDEEKQKPDNFTIPVALKACVELREFNYGEMIHAFVKKDATVGSDLYVGSSLIDMYAKFGKMNEALKVFDELEKKKPDIVTWSSMVSGFEKNGFPSQSIDFFKRMVTDSDVEPDRVTLITLLSACTKLSNSRLGRTVHGFVIKRGFGNDLSLVNSLLNCYAKSKALKECVNLFKTMTERDVISWSTVIASYVSNGNPTEALRLFDGMIENGTEEPNIATMLCVLQACGAVHDLEKGKKLHKLVIKKSLEKEVKISTALVDMYMKCYSPEEAYEVFIKIQRKDVVSYVALINGFNLNGMAQRSIHEFSKMLLLEEGNNKTRPDAILMVKVLSSCSELGFLEQAECFHSYVMKFGFSNNNKFIGASLIELYSKCGSLNNAVKVFNEITVKDTVVYTSLITGYGIHGEGEKALKTFNEMVNISKPNEVTFLSILSACSHSGLIQDGLRIFELIDKPNLEHYAVLVDLLGRVGELDKAIEIIRKMPFEPTAKILGSVLGACRIHQNDEIAEIVGKKLFVELGSNHAGYYMLLSNVYGVKGEWLNMEKLRGISVKKKRLAESLIEIKKKVHRFVADDELHPEIESVYGLLKQLDLHIQG